MVGRCQRLRLKPLACIYGATPTSGLTVSLPSGDASISTGTTLSNAGLLANGATLWFSFLLDADDASGANDGMAMSLGSASTIRRQRIDAELGGQRGRHHLGQGRGLQGKLLECGHQIPSTTSSGNSKNPTLVVASITWGADDASNEVLSIYLPSQSLALPASPAVTYTIPPLTQSAFNTISFARRGTDGLFDLIDEIRFGSSYDSVTGQAQITGDGTPPTLAVSAIVDDRGGATVAAGSVVTYTMTFSEDMNAATVGADDFSNAGSAAMTIGSIVETSPGVFTVQATPTTGGTLRLQVAAGAFLADMGGNLLGTSSAIPDDTTINVNSVPTWTSNPLNGSAATEDAPYSQNLATAASGCGPWLRFDLLESQRTILVERRRQRHHLRHSHQCRGRPEWIHR